MMMSWMLRRTRTTRRGAGVWRKGDGRGENKETEEVRRRRGGGAGIWWLYMACNYLNIITKTMITAKTNSYRFQVRINELREQLEGIAGTNILRRMLTYTLFLDEYEGAGLAELYFRRTSLLLKVRVASWWMSCGGLGLVVTVGWVTENILILLLSLKLSKYYLIILYFYSTYDSVILPCMSLRLRQLFEGL